MADHLLRGWGSVCVKTLAVFPLMFVLLSCNSGQPYPIIKPDGPSWLQSTSPKTFTASIKHPHIEDWEILAPKVTFQVGSQPAQVGNANLTPQGNWAFSIPSGQDGDLLAFKTVTFEWTAQARLRGGQDQVDLDSGPQSFVIHCLPNDRGRTSPSANVDRPERLQVLNPCMVFSGTLVVPQLFEHAQDAPTFDGDTHLEITPDQGFERFLQPTNLGNMVAEIVPGDKPSCNGTPVVPIGQSDSIASFGPCTGANIPDPALGSHVTVTGPLVIDTQAFHPRWAEIHPVWAITTTPLIPLPTPTIVPTPPPIPTFPTPTPPHIPTPPP